MGTVAVIGEETRVRGFGLAGAVVLVADTPAAARAAWAALPRDVSLAILTPAAASALGGAGGDLVWWNVRHNRTQDPPSPHQARERRELLVAVMP